MDNKTKLLLVKYAGTLPGNPVGQQVHNATPSMMDSGNLPGRPIPDKYAPHDPFQPGGAKVETFTQNPKPNALPPAPTTSTSSVPTQNFSDEPQPGTPEFYQQKQQEQSAAPAPVQQPPNAPQTGNTPEPKMPYYTGAWSG